MDLSLIGDLLGDFATFGKNIGNFLSLPPEILEALSSFAAEGTGSSALVETSSIIESSSLSSETE